MPGTENALKLKPAVPIADERLPDIVTGIKWLFDESLNQTGERDSVEKGPRQQAMQRIFKISGMIDPPATEEEEQRFVEFYDRAEQEGERLSIDQIRDLRDRYTLHPAIRIIDLLSRVSSSYAGSTQKMKQATLVMLSEHQP